MINLVRRNHWIWLGPIIALVGGVSYFLVFAQFPVLRDFPWLNLPLMILGVLASFAGVWVASKRPRDSWGRRSKIALATLGFAASLGLLSLFVWYIVDFSSRLPDPPSLAGKAAPDFVLSSTQGDTVQLSDYRGKKILLVFYRGHW